MSLHSKVTVAALCLLLTLTATRYAKADPLDVIGLNALLLENDTLTGAGITVGIVEPAESADPPKFHFNPEGTDWGEDVPVWFFHGGENSGYIPDPTSPDSGRQYNSGQTSGHAGLVAEQYASVASGVSKVEVFEADYFIRDILAPQSEGEWQPVAVQSRIVSQSYIIEADSQASVNSEYNLLFDAYANHHGTFFVNGVKNSPGETPYTPGAMYNGLTVGNEDGQNSPGVHLVGPQKVSSYATPMAAGSAAVLLQAAAQQFPTDTGASDNRVLKALLINGANKNAISNWGSAGVLSNGLDSRYGAGMLNVYDSYKTLMGGRLVTSTSAAPVLQTQNTGWNLATLTAGTSNSYFFEMPADGIAENTITATLTWNSVTTNVSYSEISKAFIGENRISDFSLGLYRIDDGNAVLVSLIDSADSNVEHLYLTGLTEGIYELRVTLDSVATNITNGQDIYALAFSLGQVPEPSTALLICLGATYSLLSRRRKSAA